MRCDAVACCGVTSLTLPLRFQAFPQSISRQRKECIIAVKKDLLPSPTLLLQPLSVCVCVLAWPNMCAESERQEGVHHWGMCTCNFSYLTQLVFCRVSGIRKCLWKLWLLPSASPPFQLLKKRDIFTMVFSISERVTHSADWPNRKKAVRAALNTEELSDV